MLYVKMLFLFIILFIFILIYECLTLDKLLFFLLVQNTTVFRILCYFKPYYRYQHLYNFAQKTMKDLKKDVCFYIGLGYLNPEMQKINGRAEFMKLIIKVGSFSNMLYPHFIMSDMGGILSKWNGD